MNDGVSECVDESMHEPTNDRGQGSQKYSWKDYGLWTSFKSQIYH